MRTLERPDPAPSRVRYRMERLMLTPLFRALLRVVLPLALIGGAGAAWISVPDNRAAFGLMMADLRAQIESRPELQVKMMAIDGASEPVAEEIRATLALDFPVSSLDLDLGRLHAAVMALDAVEAAELRMRQGGVLQVDVVERVPAILWRGPGGLVLLDAEGARVGVARRRRDHPDLPVIAGEGARASVPEALALYAATGPIRPRLRGLERMGARRWDVVLDQGQRIMLPETGAVRALERAIVMDEAEGILADIVTAVDLRLPRRPTLRLQPEAAVQMWEIRMQEAGGEQQQ